MNQPPPSTFPGLPQQQQQQYPIASSPAGYPIQPPQGQQLQYYPNPGQYPPQTRAPQIHQPVQHAYGSVPLHTGPAGGGAMMMTPGLAHHSPGVAPHQNFSAPPYMHSAAPTTLGPPSHPQSQSHHITAGPQAHPQTMGTVTAQNPLFATPPRMSQPGAQVQPPSQAPFSPQPVIPPQVAAREKARVTVLLDINSALIQEVVNLQAAGKAGMPPTQPGSQQSSPTQETGTASPTSTADFQGAQSQNAGPDGARPANKPSQEFLECMRRLQANLAYLATVADRGKKSGAAAPQAPAILNPPPNVPSINELYAKLNELFSSQSKGGSPATPQRQGTGPQPSPQGNGTPFSNPVEANS
ncbi:hypothetical protein AJ80_02399 [Polytolypa hystricis UAMH7299]|uniref:Glutamine repeat protein-1 n=1 Tax=Polytolypa hystricis (strain UAMH7299) TaxID=1447883 RepID=A0A2B7YRV9_POLH7|nr:hypothetical protein AJ80_02399 [Polytolypa hystricis UAMH7299]